MKKIFVLLLAFGALSAANAQTPDAAESLFYRLREKVLSVRDYTAQVRMNIDVSFMRVPPLSGVLYFKSPDKLRLERHGGLSILPRKSINLTLGNLLPVGNATVIDAGTELLGDQPVRVLKVVPQDDRSDIVLTKLWVDENRLLALRGETTTRDNGTVRMELEYGRFQQLALPDKVVFYLDVKSYKMPKGMTMDYDPGSSARPAGDDASKAKPRKGKIAIVYRDYKINTGLSDAVFQEKR
jgi:outer membrane lipoprotein-sorting protein